MFFHIIDYILNVYSDEVIIVVDVFNGAKLTTHEVPLPKSFNFLDTAQVKKAIEDRIRDVTLEQLDSLIGLRWDLK